MFHCCSPETQNVAVTYERDGKGIQEKEGREIKV
jgi:hypothetical protein